MCDRLYGNLTLWGTLNAAGVLTGAVTAKLYQVTCVSNKEKGNGNLPSSK